MLTDTQQATLALLTHLPLFVEVPEPALVELATQTRETEFAPEAVIFSQGDPCDRVWILRLGQVKIVHQAEDGREVIIEMISPGEAFGGAVLFMPRHPATARAMTMVVAVSFASDNYTRLLREQPTLSLKLIRMLGQRLHAMMGLSVLAGERVERRIAHILLKLAERVGRADAEGTLITISLSRQDLADMSGTTLETTIRTISRFREQGWVKTRRGGFLVLTDEDALKRVGN